MSDPDLADLADLAADVECRSDAFLDYCNSIVSYDCSKVL